MSPSFYLSPKGRVSRSQLWLKFHLPAIGIAFITLLIDYVFGTFNEELGLGLFSGVFTLIMFWPSVAVSVKRLHDRDKSWWFYLLSFVPVVNIWIWIEMYVLGGTEGENQFGPDPRNELVESTSVLAQ